MVSRYPPRGTPIMTGGPISRTSEDAIPAEMMQDEFATLLERNPPDCLVVVQVGRWRPCRNPRFKRLGYAAGLATVLVCDCEPVIWNIENGRC